MTCCMRHSYAMLFLLCLSHMIKLSRSGCSGLDPLDQDGPPQRSFRPGGAAPAAAEALQLAGTRPQLNIVQRQSGRRHFAGTLGFPSRSKSELFWEQLQTQQQQGSESQNMMENVQIQSETIKGPEGQRGRAS